MMCNNSCAFKCDQNQNGQADAPPDGRTESQLNQYKQDVCTMIGTDCIKEATTGDDDSDAIGYPLWGWGRTTAWYQKFFKSVQGLEHGAGTVAIWTSSGCPNLIIASVMKADNIISSTSTAVFFTTSVTEHAQWHCKQLLTSHFESVYEKKKTIDLGGEDGKSLGRIAVPASRRCGYGAGFLWNLPRRDRLDCRR